jgi:hypothetical protein
LSVHGIYFSGDSLTGMMGDIKLCLQPAQALVMDAILSPETALNIVDFRWAGTLVVMPPSLIIMSVGDKWALHVTPALTDLCAMQLAELMSDAGSAGSS